MSGAWEPFGTTPTQEATTVTMILRRLSPLAAIFLSLALLTACGGGDGTASASSSGKSQALAPEEGRPFDASKSTVVKAILTAMPAKKADWNGKTMTITFEKSQNSGTTYCLAAEGLLADDEKAVLKFPGDGEEIDCATRFDDD